MEEAFGGVDFYQVCHRCRHISANESAFLSGELRNGNKDVLQLHLIEQNASHSAVDGYMTLHKTDGTDRMSACCLLRYAWQFCESDAKGKQQLLVCYRRRCRAMILGQQPTNPECHGPSSAASQVQEVEGPWLSCELL